MSDVFNFKGADQGKRIGDLSGGERNRVHLAKLLKTAVMSCCSTNRLTIWMWKPCALWKKRCSAFPGCAVVISHDRWFLDRIATHMLAFEATVRLSGLKATMKIMKPIVIAAWAVMRIIHIDSNIKADWINRSCPQGSGHILVSSGQQHILKIID